jgi:drug/metabolite transporter (DMT)-like permease
MLLMVAGGVLLILNQGGVGNPQFWGLFAVIAATAAWAVDNTLSRALADRDPGRVIFAKSALGAAATTLLALLFREPLPPATAMLGLVVVGASGYGLSLRFYLLAQRAFGAARTGSVFAFAPFIGAALAIAMGDRSAGWMMAAGGLLMMVGVVLHLAETHAHAHHHDPLQHEHAHRHDDGHHDHAHDPMPAGPHSHLHVHKEESHAHPHVPDAHHAHRH